MRTSTRELFAKHGWRVDRALHNYIYFVFYYPYVKTMYRLMKFISVYLYWFSPFRMVLNAAFNRYHSKVLTSGDAGKLFSINEDFRAISEKNKRIIPFKYAYRILLLGANHIAVMDCPCKKTLKDRDWSINSCIAVGKGIAGFWLDHGKKYNVRKIGQNEAMELIRLFRSRGYLTQAFFKVATGGSTGVICNCHPDTCVSLKATLFAKKIDNRLTMNAASGYSVMRDGSRCELCGNCVDTCPVNAVLICSEEIAYDRLSCLGCGLCADNCPRGALTLYRDSEKPLPLDLDMIKKD